MRSTAEFNRVTVAQEDIQQKVLRVAIPPSTRYIPTRLQAGVLEEIHKAADQKKIRMIIQEVGG